MHMWFHAQLTQKILNGIYQNMPPAKDSRDVMILESFAKYTMQS